jgi:inner membrane protein
VSQAALGAAAALAVASQGDARRAAVLGALAGMAPDLDVLARSQSDPLLFLAVHRQFTHALAFIPLGAALCALAAFPFVRGRATFRRTYTYCMIGYATHGVLDACTSYGTQLLWPFSSLRVAWSNIAVVDPLFTLPLLVLVIAAARVAAPSRAQWACAWAIAYLLLGVVQRERVEAVSRELAVRRGHVPMRMQVKPAFGSLVLWKTLYEHDGMYYVDAVRIVLGATTYPGERTRVLVPERDLPWLDAGSTQARDVERFTRFSSGYVALHPDDGARIIDVRYSMVPNRVDALWGIRLDPGAPHGVHAAFYTARRVSPEDRSALLRMLLGQSG